MTQAIILAAELPVKNAPPVNPGDSSQIESALSHLEQLGVERITVVLGQNWEELSDLLEGRGAELIANPHPERGEMSSIQWGLAQTKEGADSFLIYPAELEGIGLPLLQTMLERFQAGGKRFLIASQNERLLPLALFDASFVEQILALPIEQSFLPLMQAHSEETLVFEIEA